MQSSSDTSLAATFSRGLLVFRPWAVTWEKAQEGLHGQPLTVQLSGSKLSVVGSLCVLIVFGARESPDLSPMVSAILCNILVSTTSNCGKGSKAWNKMVFFFISLRRKGKAGLQSFHPTGFSLHIDPLGGLGVFYLKIKNKSLLLNTKLLFLYQMNSTHLGKTKSFYFWLAWSMHFAEISPYQISITVEFAAPVSTGKLVTIQY